MGQAIPAWHQCLCADPVRVQIIYIVSVQFLIDRGENVYVLGYLEQIASRSVAVEEEGSARPELSTPAMAKVFHILKIHGTGSWP